MGHQLGREHDSTPQSGVEAPRLQNGASPDCIVVVVVVVCSCVVVLCCVLVWCVAVCWCVLVFVCVGMCAGVVLVWCCGGGVVMFLCVVGLLHCFFRRHAHTDD